MGVEHNRGGVGLFSASIIKKMVKMEQGERRNKCIFD
jgi:hypothetical protein